MKRIISLGRTERRLPNLVKERFINMSIRQNIGFMLAMQVMTIICEAAEPVEGGNMPKAADMLAVKSTVGPSGGVYVMPKETLEQKDVRMKWFREVRYGLFIHWGPSSISGSETSWSRNGKRAGEGGQKPPNGRDEVYDNLYKQFNPERFNAEEWVKLATDAGMKYIVFTCKHHDGFCNFLTKYTDYNIGNSPFKRDIVKELADACHQAGLRFGVYYSQRDWYHPDYMVDGNRKYREFFHNQLKELLNNYGKVDILWFDSQGGDWTDWNYPQMAEVILKSQPDIVCNGRIGVLQPQTKDFRVNYDATRLSDFQTPEQVIGAFERNRYWESCTCLVDGQWGYKPDGLLMTLREVMGMLLYSSGGDGNLLLDVAPTPLGNFEPRQIARLKEVGDWLKQYGDSYYGTRGGPYKPGYWGVCTLNGNKIFLHALSFHGDTLTLPPLPAKVAGSRLLTGGNVEVKQTADALVVKVDPKDQQKIDTLVELTIEGNAFNIKPIDVKDPETLLLGLGKHKKSALAKVTKFDAPPKKWWYNPCGPGDMFDNCRLTSWVPDPGTGEVVVSVNLGKPTSFNSAAIEADGSLDRVEVKAKIGTEWKPLGSLENPAGPQTLQLPPTTAQELQLVFTSKAKAKFHVWEFQLFK